VAAQRDIGGHEGKWFAAALTSRIIKGSSRPHFQPDADLSGIFGEMNTGVLKSFLYFEDGCEIPFHCSLGLFGPSQSCKTDAGLTGAAN
jgi:hypothetical protein